jgi:hypothetical protein
MAIFNKKNTDTFFLVGKFLSFFVHQNPGSGTGSSSRKMLDPDPLSQAFSCFGLKNSD